MLPGALPRVAVMPGCDRVFPATMAQVRTVSGAGPYRPLAANSLLLSHFLKILVPFCAEDYWHLADYQPFSCHQNRVVEGPWGGPSKPKWRRTGAEGPRDGPSRARGSRYGRENGRNRSIGGPFGPPAARYRAKPCRQRSPNARVAPFPTPSCAVRSTAPPHWVVCGGAVFGSIYRTLVEGWRSPCARSVHG